MKIGLMVSISLAGDPAPADIAAAIGRAEADGFASVWASGRFDALTQLALAAPRTERIELGTAVVPTYPRHPTALAQQAATVQAASGGRLALGIGVSHRTSMQAIGLDSSRPIRHMREYLTCLTAMLAGDVVDVDGVDYHVERYQLPAATAITAPSVLVAALAPQMLRLTGRLADGTIVWLGGPRYFGEVAVPTISAAAREAGRPAPRIVAGGPVCLTSDGDAARLLVAARFQRMGEQPVYRAVLDRDRSAGPADVALVGDEATIEASVRRLADAGVTDIAAQIVAASPEEAERTYAFLAAHAGAQTFSPA